MDTGVWSRLSLHTGSPILETVPMDMNERFLNERVMNERRGRGAVGVLHGLQRQLMRGRLRRAFRIRRLAQRPD